MQGYEAPMALGNDIVSANVCPCPVPVSFVSHSAGHTSGTIGEAYSNTITLAGTAPFALDEDNSTYPDWATVTISGNEATITGTPDQEDNTFELVFTNWYGEYNVEVNYDMTAEPACVEHAFESHSNETHESAVVGEYYENIITYSGTGPIILTSSTLPDGLNATENGDNTITVSGTPNTDGVYGIVIETTNCDGFAQTVNWDLTVE